MVKTLPLRFLKAIKVGADLSRVWSQLVIWLLVDEAHGVIKFTKREQSIQAIKAVAAAYERNETKLDEWIKLRQAAAAEIGRAHV